MADTLSPPARTGLPPTLDLAATDEDRLFRWSVSKYHAAIASGLLGDEDRCELLEGVLVEKMPKDPIHESVIAALNQALHRFLPEGWFVRVAAPITTADSEPEPDIVVARGRPRDYAKRHPAPGDSGLVIEVANSSLRRDRGLKLRIYANAGCATYWVVDTTAETVEVFTDPNVAGHGGYVTRRLVTRGEHMAVALDERRVGEIAVDDLFPPQA